jgi:hypothetical protein
MYAVLLSTMLALPLLPVAPVPGPTSLLASVKTYEAATNQHDWTAVGPLLADNAVIELGDDLALVGRESARDLHEWERTMGTEIHFTGCTVEDQTVTCRAREQNDFQRLAGLAPIEYSATSITFEKGRIVRMTAMLSDESSEAVSRYMQPFLAWASKADQNGTNAFLKPDGSFAFGSESATAFKRLLRVYALTQKSGARAL